MIPQCEICGAVGLERDHCHRHNVVRGWLCYRCNSRMAAVDRNGFKPNASIHWTHADSIQPYLDWHARCEGCGPVTRPVAYKRNSARLTGDNAQKSKITVRND